MPASLLQKAGMDLVALVDRSGPAVAADEVGSMVGCRGRHQGVVGGATRHGFRRQGPDEFPIGSGGQAQIGLREAYVQEIPDDVTADSMRRRQASEDRVRFEGTVLDEAKPGIQRPPRLLMPLVPGCERRYDEAGV